MDTRTNTQRAHDQAEPGVRTPEVSAKSELSEAVTIPSQGEPRADGTGLSPGTELGGRYRIERELGRGGMGHVFLAHDLDLGREVAVKVVVPERAEPRHLEVLEREARLIAALGHPNILQVYDIGWLQIGPFVVEEYLEGETLAQLVARGPVRAREVLGLLLEVSQGLAAAHDRGIVHCDLKPSNIFLTRRGEVKILDFGIARFCGRRRAPESEPGPGTPRERTGAEGFAGTPAYASPEQLRGAALDARSDVYSLGVTGYELLCGTLPFDNEADAGSSAPGLPANVPRALRRLLLRCLEEDPALRPPDGAALARELSHIAERQVWPTIGRLLRQRRVAMPLAAALLAAVGTVLWRVDRQRKVRWATEVAIPEIERLVSENDYWRNLVAPYRLAQQAERYVPEDRRLAKLLSACSIRINVRTDPPGAKVYMQDYRAPAGEWEYLGETPLAGVRVPVGVLRWKLVKEGFDPVLAATRTWDFDSGPRLVQVPVDLVRKLDRAGALPAGMVRVSGARTDKGEVHDFFLDRLEVSNREYKRFIDAGGYRDRRFWKHPFARDGREINTDEALRGFRDQSGQPGPSTWRDGSYPEGKGEHPVTGVSWYEAAAYAEFVGKSLPTAAHWRAAEAGDQPFGFPGYLYQSNFNGTGTVPAGTLAGMTPYGNLDMGGNAREWCWNETDTGRAVRGGSWNDSIYMACTVSQLPAMDRSDQNGFRLAVYPSEQLDATVFRRLHDEPPPDFSRLQPVSDAVFRVYRAQFDYDPLPLNARVEWRKENPEGWTWEKVTLDAPYAGERMAVHLFLPSGVSPPYQTVIYFPGAGSLFGYNSDGLEEYHEFRMYLSFLLAAGRAVVYPVYKGTFERADSKNPEVPDPSSKRYSEWTVQIIQDFRRSVEYLEKRPDLDASRFGYLGLSLGGHLWNITGAVEPRIRASVVFGGGLFRFLLRARPEVNLANYVTRVSAPTLMLNGRYDFIAADSKAMFDLLGSTAGEKELKLYDTAHFIPRDALVRESQRWFDRYLGPVQRPGPARAPGDAPSRTRR